MQGASLPITRRTNQASSFLESEYLSACATPGRIVSPTSAVLALSLLSGNAMADAPVPSHKSRGSEFRYTAADPPAVAMR